MNLSLHLHASKRSWREQAQNNRLLSSAKSMREYIRIYTPTQCYFGLIPTQKEVKPVTIITTFA